MEERAELIKTLNALGNQPMTLTSPHFVKSNSGEDCDKEMVKKSKIKKTNGGYLNISYDCWKPRYVDEYTGEVLQDNLIHEAMIDELDYFNEHVWEVDTLEHMKTVPDYILVRSRWVMANKGDSAEPDMRARLVGCEVNKGGEKNDQFFASTPPLEAKKLLFSEFSSEQKQNVGMGSR